MSCNNTFADRLTFIFYGFSHLLLCFLQLSTMFEKVSSSHRNLEDEMKEQTDKNESMAHWEAQITEIIQW